MTIETKHFIEALDIVGFRFDCKACGASLSVPASDNRSKLPLDNCPLCNATWKLRSRLAYDELIAEFRESLDKLQKMTGSDYAEPLGFAVVLEIKAKAASGIAEGKS